VPKLSCQMNFCKMMNFQLMQFSNFFPKPCMFLLLLCLGTILAPTSLASCQPSCSPPPSSGSVGAASFHPLNHSTMAPTRFCATVPASSPYESGRGTRWSPSAALKPAWLRMPCRGRPLGSRPGGPAPTKRFLHLLLIRRHHKRSRSRFPTRQRRFLHTRYRRRLHSLHRCSTCPVNGHHPRG
jgi:hypothetical protein